VDSLLGEPTDWRLPWRLTTASLVGLSALGVLIWRLGEAASADATFNLPILTSRPCLAVMTLLVLVCVGAVALRESSQSRRATATSTTLA
jgi:hypothetical protein